MSEGSKLRVPRSTATVLDLQTLLESEIRHDTTNDELRYGDGVTVGGIPLAKKDGSNLNASASRVTSTGSTTERTLADRFAEVFNILDYGADADASDNYAAVNLAIAACSAAGGGTIYVPEGNFEIDLPSATGLTALGTGTRLRGAGEYVSTLTINTTTTTYLTVLGNASNFICEDLTIQFNCQDGQEAALIIPGSNVRFRRSRLLSNCTAVGDVATNTSILFNFLTTGTQTDISIEDCEVAGWGFPTLQTNASTSTRRRLRFINNYFHDNAGSHINLNSPNGVMDDVVIADNTFADEIGFGAGLGFMVGLASISNFAVVGNTFTGSTNGEAIHIEENCVDFTVADNTIEITSDETGEGDGIFLSSNNIAGSWTAPQRFTISGNVIRRTGGAAAAGIHLVDTSGSTPITNGDITGNFITGFTNAYDIATALSSSLFIETRSLRPEGAGVLFGNTLSNNGSDATNDIDVTAGYCADSTNAVFMTCGALTKRLDANWAVGTNQGGLDTGSIADGTYHVFRIMRLDTGIVDVLASTSATAPTMPTNYTYKRRIGSIVRSSGSILAFTQDGDEFLLSVPVQDVNTAPNNATAQTVTLTVPDGITIDAKISARLSDTSPAANRAALITAMVQADTSPGTAFNLHTFANTGGSMENVMSFTIRTNTSRQIRYRLSAADTDLTMGITTFGWVDRRGRVT